MNNLDVNSTSFFVRDTLLPMSDTLVIHPNDSSTTSLKYVYLNKGFDVIDDPDIDKNILLEEIKKHKRIIMLGHGSHLGLVHPDLIRYGKVRSGGRPFIIDDSFGELLKTKETISVWCNSDQYFKRHSIPGFHTGMIISEESEAVMFLGHCPLSKAELYLNCVILSKAIGGCIDMSPDDMKDYVLAHYIGDDKVTKYNRENIIVISVDIFK